MEDMLAGEVLESMRLNMDGWLGLGLTLEFISSGTLDWGSLSLVLTNVFLITMLTLKGVSVSTKLRPELLMLVRSLSQTVLASMFENLL